MWLANKLSLISSLVSRSKNIKSNLDNNAAGKLIFAWGVNFLSYLPYEGLAAASTDVLVFKVAVMPAFAMETVYCSMTSWIAVLSWSFILSNSSMQQTPISDKTKAPPSKVTSLVIGSLRTATVNPAPVFPFPVV